MECSFICTVLVRKLLDMSHLGPSHLFFSYENPLLVPNLFFLILPKINYSHILYDWHLNSLLVLSFSLSLWYISNQKIYFLLLSVCIKLITPYITVRTKEIILLLRKTWNDKAPFFSRLNTYACRCVGPAMVKLWVRRWKYDKTLASRIYKYD